MNLPFIAPLLGWAARRWSRVEPLTTFRPTEPRRILLVLTTGMGDAIFSTAVFSSLRTAFPSADIRLFCRAEWRELFAEDDRLSGVIPYFGKNRQLLRTLAALRAYAPDLVMVLHGNDPDILPLAALSGARHVVRIPTTATRYPDLLSNRNRAEDATPLPETHYVDNRLRILETLGIPILTRTPEIRLQPERVSRVTGKLQQQFSGRPYWVLHVHAANAYKSLPLAEAGRLIKAALMKFPDLDLVLSGGPGNRTELLPLIPPEAAGRVWVAAGTLSLADMAACLAGARLVVAPDTGILHLAAALDRPVLGLFSPTLPALVGPRAPSGRVMTLTRPQTCSPCTQKKCPYRPATCMAKFTAEALMVEMEKLL